MGHDRRARRCWALLLALPLLLELAAGAGAQLLVGKGLHPGALRQVHQGRHLQKGVLSSGSSSSSSATKKVLACKEDEAERQAKYFRSRPYSETACPAHIWLTRYQGMAPAGHKLILDIGCNQGFSSAEFFDVWAPELGVNKRTLMQAHTPPGEQANMTKCGACKEDCTSLHQTPELTHGHRVVEVHCVEPSDLHFADLNEAREKLFGVAPKARAAVKTVGASSGVWHLHNMAVSNETGVATFTSQCDNTRCHLGEEGQPGADDDSSTYKVQVTTVDTLLASLGNPNHITFMKVDTEGFDASVLAGAQKALEKKAIHMLLFEYHQMNRWGVTQLKDVSAWLEGLGYACYFEGLHHIFKITGGCWHDDYEFHNWSNVVCGLAGGQLELLLDAHSYLREMRWADATPAVPVAHPH